ncbi:MAG: portal protein, partial [Longimicrobiales bacterium]
IIPDAGGEKKIAEIREGLIRNIQKVSRAQYAYDKAFEQQVIGGLGHFQIHLDYAHDDVFEQDIRIASIPNPLAVVWDKDSVEPTGSDAQHAFVVDKLARSDFKNRYPNAQAGEWNADMTMNRHGGWDDGNTVQVVSFWRMRSKTRTVALMQDGTVQDVTDIPITEWWDLVVDKDGEPMVREVQRRYAQMYICSSQDILAGPYELPIIRIPVFRVPAWELFIEGDRIRWGHVRFLRDPQKLHNYWRSTLAEKLVGSSKHKWLASNSAVDGREEQWRNSHLSDDPLLVWNQESGQRPERAEPLQLEPALIQEAGMAAQDIRDVSNQHESSMGQQGNEVSGRAISARQRVGELGTVIYQDNLNMAIEEAGAVINQLIPFVYDTPRIVKVLGEDMLTEKLVSINGDPQKDPTTVDITLGKYSVSVTAGPSYTTRRV